MSAGAHAPKVLELQGAAPQTLGFSDGGELVLSDRPLRGSSAQLFKEHDAWHVSQRGGDRHPMMVNETGTWRARRLVHGDHLRLADAWLRYWEAPEPWFRSEEHEARIHDKPNDVRVWQVFADWLVERGDPAGGRIVQGTPRSNDEAARWLDTLAVDGWSTRIAASFAFGHVHTLTVYLGANVAVPPPALGRALAHPICRFIRGLSIASVGVEWRPQLVGQLLRHLAERPWPKSFEQLAYRSAGEGTVPDDVPLALQALKAKAPGLKTTPGELCTFLPRR